MCRGEENPASARVLKASRDSLDAVLAAHRSALVAMHVQRENKRDRERDGEIAHDS